MKIIEADSRTHLDDLGTEIITSLIQKKPDCHLVLATGNSPLGVYLGVAKAGLDCSRVKVTMLDEWHGVPNTHPASCYHYLRTHVIEPWGCPMSELLVIQSQSPSPRLHAVEIEGALSQRPPIDLCVLGVGENGHLGMNEPDSILLPGPHVSDLTEESKTHSMLADLPAPPERGITLGMANILSAGAILLLAAGQAKQQAIGMLRRGQISTYEPVSFLWLHPDVTVITADI